MQAAGRAGRYLPRLLVSDKRCKERQRGEATQRPIYITEVLSCQELRLVTRTSFLRLFGLRRGVYLAGCSGDHAIPCVGEVECQQCWQTHPAKPLLVAAMFARCVPGSVVTPQGCVLRGLLPSEQFERGQMVLQMSQPEFALQEGDVTRRFTQTR